MECRFVVLRLPSMKQSPVSQDHPIPQISWLHVFGGFRHRNHHPSLGPKGDMVPCLHRRLLLEGIRELRNLAFLMRNSAVGEQANPHCTGLANTFLLELRNRYRAEMVAELVQVPCCAGCTDVGSGFGIAAPHLHSPHSASFLLNVFKHPILRHFPCTLHSPEL